MFNPDKQKTANTLAVIYADAVQEMRSCEGNDDIHSRVDAAIKQAYVEGMWRVFIAQDINLKRMH